ncbi:GGDEF domain-containing protein [Curvibacter gracilis]|uniref:GGDEF domain-containing protein n=1 Tax=Curvibacter gracilis TaxID=230310 RepID=UPI000484D82E|nr:GGDEF domain-containing protein [Curvibacter gracilis]
MRPGGIALRLSLLLAAFSVFAAGLASHYTFVSSRAMMTERAERYLLSTTEVLARHLHASLQSVSQDALVLATHAQARALLEAPRGEPGRPQPAAREAMAQAFEAMLAAHPGYLQVRLITAQEHGLEQVRVLRQGEVLKRIPEHDLREKGHFPYVFEALAQPAGQVYLSEFAVSHDDAPEVNDMPSFTVSAPVVSQGRTLGVVALQVAARPFLQNVMSNLPGGFQLYMSNRWGDWLMHPDASQTFGFDHGQRVFIQDTFPEAQGLLSGRVQSLVTRANDPYGEPLAAAFVRLPLGAEVDQRFLLLGLAQTLSVVEGDTPVLGRSIFQVLLLVCLAALLLAVLVSRVVTEPLKAMAAATRSLGKGQRVMGLPVERRDEIGELARSFQHMEEQVWLQMSQLRSRHNAMDHLAHHDPLTGLPNRRLVEARLADALDRADRSGLVCAVLFVDLDHFKNINDGLGHEVGDAVLRAVAQRLSDDLRVGDLVGRMGGDEFVVVCEGLHGELDADPIAAKLQAQFQQPVLHHGLPIQVHASVGISLYPRDGHDVRSLLSDADAAMYRAKQGGRNSRPAA